MVWILFLGRGLLPLKELAGAKTAIREKPAVDAAAVKAGDAAAPPRKGSAKARKGARR